MGSCNPSALWGPVGLPTLFQVARNQRERAEKMRIAPGFGIALLALPWVWQTALAYDSADSIRCNGSLVNIGDTVEDLMQACGEPLQRNENQWVYEPGDGSFVQTVGVGNGKVMFIRVEQK